jgi:acyl transferase domain-containing protein
MVEPLVDAMRQLVSEVRLSPPTVPIVSTVTGRKLTDEEALSPDYWARHLRAPVLFADAVRSLAAAEDLALLEIGPRDTLAALARQSLPPAKRALVWASSNGRQAEDSAWRALLEAAGGLWAAGLALDWRAMPGPARRRKVELPSYPFAKTPCWLERRAPAEAATRPPVARQPETGFEPDAVGDGVGVSPSAGTVAALVAQQLEIMARQLRLLKGSSS